ncbi:MAG: hypothetical protein LQ346_003584 [Caloplaca aetnensis]|nr:MAG: hypothetical protein LQ346_003584 [Caloplaca aetnensis]
MGNAESRRIVDEIAPAVHAGSGLNTILRDEKVVPPLISQPAVILLIGVQIVRLCNAQIQLLDPETQQSVRDLVNYYPDLRKRKSCTTKIQQLQERDVVISSDLIQLLQQWEDPEEFFKPIQSRVGASVTHQIYWALRHVSQRGDEPVRARIYAVALYDLRVSTGEDETTVPPILDDDPIQLTFSFRNTVIPLIRRSEEEDVEKWIAMYLKYGHRMKALALNNGGLGALALLPSSLLSLRQ